jgi:hypothetical protein
MQRDENHLHVPKYVAQNYKLAINIKFLTCLSHKLSSSGRRQYKGMLNSNVLTSRVQY